MLSVTGDLAEWSVAPLDLRAVTKQKRLLLCFFVETLLKFLNRIVVISLGEIFTKTKLYVAQRTLCHNSFIMKFSSELSDIEILRKSPNCGTE